ncbi:MAG: hypothetical protein GY742_05025 [Hyphomicrobiales bacterium]|nr:hypothetical protein [Hyphomicrobiales bacterium]
MIRWIRPFRKSSRTISLSICGALFALLFCLLFYLVWHHGADTVMGIPLQLMLITIIFPLLTAGLLFWLARKFEELAWQGDDE